MAYIGKNLVGVLKENRTVVTSTGDGSASLELNETPGSVNNVLVFLDGIRQQPTTDYTVSGSMLTFTTGPQTGVKIVAIVGNHSGVEPKKGSVTTRKIVDGAVTGQKLADGNIPTSKFTGALPALDGSNLLGVHSDTIHKSPNDPAINTNTIDGQTVTLGQIWVNTTSGEMYICTDVTENAQHWMNVGAGEGDYTNVPPTNPTNTGVFQNVSENETYNFTFTGATDPDGSVTHYMVDNISPVGALTVAAAEVAATTAHTFTASAVDADTPVTFRVRAKDNNGAYSSGVTVSMTVTDTPLSAATGGDNNSGNGTIDGNFKYHVFNNSGTFTVSLSNATFEYLVVAGGGGGGSGWGGGGGGGAGGYLAASGVSLNNASYTVTVGGPGARSNGTPVGGNGTNSVLSGSGLTTVTSIGGGGGASGGRWNAFLQSANSGGSGGGGGSYPAPTGNPGGGTSGQGNSGGSGDIWYSAGSGGGGGASQVGESYHQHTPATDGGHGGDGIQNLIAGTGHGESGYYAGGGGGGVYTGTSNAAGGNGGGGLGGDNNPLTGTAGQVNTGGGGGGGNYDGGNSPGSAGGKGIVIIRYRYQ